MDLNRIELRILRERYGLRVKRRTAERFFRYVQAINTQESLKLDIHFPRLLPDTTVGCTISQNTMTINFDGSVSPCFVAGMTTSVFLDEKYERKRSSISFGNILDEKPLSIWRLPDYLAFRCDAASDDPARHPGICKSCLRSCNVICTSPTTPTYLKDV